MNGVRKFVIAIYFGTAIFLLCYLHRVSGGECITGVGILAGLYKAANVIDKKFGGAG